MYCCSRLSRRLCSLMLSLSLLLPTISRAADAETPAQKAERMNWWVDARFGMFIHWGLLSMKGTEMGRARDGESPLDVDNRLAKEFNPVKFDAKDFVALAKEAGMKYMVLVVKHHDGFSMNATKLGGFNVMNTPFKRDVTKELADECRKQGIRFCTYYSIIDWHHPDYLPRRARDQRPTEGANFDNYCTFLKEQLREIMVNYHPAVMWFDGEWEDTWTVERARDVYAMLRQLDPAVIVNNRLGKGRKWGKESTHGMTPPETTVGDFGTPEQSPGRAISDRNVYWESNMTICRSWAWRSDDKLKTLKQCIDLLVTNAGRDGNFLLNVGPIPSGEIEPDQAQRLREIGRWMKQYGQSIYGTRGGPFKSDTWGVSTCKGDTIYVHVLRWQDDGPLQLPALGKKIVASRLLGSGDVEVKQADTGITIAVPSAARQELDTVIELKLDGSAMDIPSFAEK